MPDAKPLNVGPKSAAWLRQVGVRSLDDLSKMGAVAAFARVRKAGFKPSLNLLYALEAALRGCHWTALPASDKQRLVSEANAIEEAQKKAKQLVMPARDLSPARENDEAEATIVTPGLLDEPAADEADEPGNATVDGSAD